MSIQATELIVTPEIALSAMPRAKEMGRAALELCTDADRKVPSGDRFIDLIRTSLADIEKWANHRGEIIPDQVMLFQRMSEDALRNLQRQHHFSGIQVLQWRGEMKMQISALKRAETHRSVGH